MRTIPEIQVYLAEVNDKLAKFQTDIDESELEYYIELLTIKCTLEWVLGEAK